MIIILDGISGMGAQFKVKSVIYSVSGIFLNQKHLKFEIVYKEDQSYFTYHEQNMDEEL